MKDNELEAALRDLGRDWKTDPKFVSNVLDGIQSSRKDSEQPTQNKGLTMLKINLIGLATAALVTIGFFFLPVDSPPVSANSLTLAIQKAVSNTKTVRVITYAYDQKTSKKKPITDTWLQSERGFSRYSRGGGFFEIDNGKYYWCRLKKGAPVNRTKTKRQDAILPKNGILTLASLGDSKFDRLPKEDITDGNVKLSCYAYRNLAPFPEGPQRCYLYLRKDNRIHKTVTWMFKNNVWNLFSESHFHYNIHIDDSVFQLDSNLEDKVVDLDAKFDKLLQLKQNLFQKKSDGFEFSVHRVLALKGGGVVLKTSLRKAESNRRKNSSAKPYTASPQFSNNFRLELGRTSHRDVNVQWHVRVPRDPNSKWNPIKDGHLSLKELYTQREKPFFLTKSHGFRSVQIDAKVENPNKPISLEDAAKLVYKEHTKLAGFQSDLDGGVYRENGTLYQKMVNVDSVSESEFAKLVSGHLKHWRDHDRPKK